LRAASATASTQRQAPAHRDVEPIAATPERQGRRPPCRRSVPDRFSIGTVYEVRSSMHAITWSARLTNANTTPRLAATGP